MKIAIYALLLLGLPLALGGGALQGEPANPGSFYRATFLLPQAHIATITARAQELGFWIRIQQGQEVTYLQGAELCSACNPESEESFFGFPQLYLDEDLFLVRLDEERYRLSVRPSAQNKGHYEVIVGVKVQSELEELRGEALNWLQKLGIVQTASLSLAEFPVEKKPQPPEGVRLDSLLYALTQAPDWHDFARERGLPLQGIRIKVIVELATPEAVLQGYHLIEEARSTERMRVLVPVSELIRLAKDPAVEFVRLPYEPHEAEGG